MAMSDNTWENQFKEKAEEILIGKGDENRRKTLIEQINIFIKNASNNENIRELLSPLVNKNFQALPELYSRLENEDLCKILGTSYEDLNNAKNIPNKIEEKESFEELCNVLTFINLMVEKKDNDANKIETKDNSYKSFLKRLKNNNKIDYHNMSSDDFILLFQKSFFYFSDLRDTSAEYLVNNIYIKDDISKSLSKTKKNIVYDESAIELIFSEDTKDIDNFIKEIKNAKNKSAKEEIFFRGQTNMNYMVFPSLFRDEKFYKKEAEICDEATRIVPHEFVNKSTKLDQLVHMQHFELPPRILDISTDYKVGLFFACYDLYETNIEKYGEVILLSSDKSYYSRSDDEEIERKLSVIWNGTIVFEDGFIS